MGHWALMENYHQSSDSVFLVHITGIDGSGGQRSSSQVGTLACRQHSKAIGPLD